jgi:transposase-like protein
VIYLILNPASSTRIWRRSLRSERRYRPVQYLNNVIGQGHRAIKRE